MEKYKDIVILYEKTFKSIPCPQYFEDKSNEEVANLLKKCVEENHPLEHYLGKEYLDFVEEHFYDNENPCDFASRIGLYKKWGKKWK